ncbi:MAG: hypothetical protein ABJH05_13360 [Fulvivirga sp.]
MKRKLNKKLLAVILALQTIVSIGFLIYAFYKQTQNNTLKEELVTLKTQLENCQSTLPR